MPKKQANHRFEESDLERLGELARRSGMTASDVLRRLIPDPTYLRVCAALPIISGETDLLPAEVLIELAGEGLRARMLNGEPAIDPYWVEGLDAKATAELYLAYLDALAHKAGVATWHGGEPRHHFQKPPTGGNWQRDNVMGWAVLGIDERFTRSGIERIHQAGDHADG